MKKRLNILCILVFIVLGLSLYTTGYQFGTCWQVISGL